MIQFLGLSRSRRAYRRWFGLLVPALCKECFFRGEFTFLISNKFKPWEKEKIKKGYRSIHLLPGGASGKRGQKQGPASAMLLSLAEGQDGLKITYLFQQNSECSQGN